MSLFNRLSGQPPQQANPQQMLQQLRADPAGMLKQRGFTIPQGMTDPRSMVQHLLQTGQVSNPRMQQAMQMMGKR